MSNLAEKTAIVTGGARGIGRAIVLELAKHKVNVAFSFHSSESKANELVKEIEQSNGKAIAVRADVRDQKSSKLFLEETKKAFGKVHFLVNNAGILKDKTLMMMSEEDWKDVIDTNLGGTFNLTRLLITHFLKEKSGVIVNISSTAGLMGSAGQTNYSASKAGIIGFTKALAREVSPYGIRVNAVAPGFIDTDMVKTIPPDKLKEAQNWIPMRRIGLPEEAAKAVVFLLSDEASYITGHVLPVDGGLAI
ncbi:MAG: 3-oxoacyl-[acyl-carrier-protein] reductase [Candidatus Omnitrophica bacterium CG07_land_8_20_14_0_80_50_8]|nr:MAG: 3-oxoacyl-[acyl-carrier-protein] reductase [Candidatus Omnitrophica bacterium CG07_land_8_20_14_0_80_50_8]